MSIEICIDIIAISNKIISNIMWTYNSLTYPWICYVSEFFYFHFDSFEFS